ncbi:MAG: glycosyltransferase [Balneolaceae bacterium]
MNHSSVDISIVIVNYNVKEYLASLLNSIDKAANNLVLETFVVDNASNDGSKEFIPSRFPEIKYIYNRENVGFGVANNQAIAQAKGKYILIINPDTLVSEDTLTTLFNHMEANAKCGAAGCKILNPDGTFAPESRRSVPSIWTAGTKLLGLSALFPKSKLFGQYYLSWMGEDEPSQISVLSGSFMFWRASVLKELEGFDERFFMYGEDIDLCYRIQELGYYIDYVPSTSIIHYKGESTKKGNLKYIKLFNKALYQFFEKTYGPRYSYIFKVLIYIAVLAKTITSFVITQIKKFALIITDLIILNSSFAIGFGIRFGFDMEVMTTPDKVPYLFVNLLLSIIYVTAAGFFGLFKENAHSLSAHLKSVFITFTGVVFITFFARDYAFSRLILGLSFLIGTSLMILHRLWIANRTKTSTLVSGRFRSSRIVIVGGVDDVQHLVSKINSRPDWSYEVVGIVTPELEINDENKVKILGSLPQLKELVAAYGIEQVFFSLGTVSYKQMLNEIGRLQKEGIVFKLIPESMEYILGKSNVEYLESIPLVKVEFEYSKPSNIFIKRSLDLFVAAPMFLLLLIPAILMIVFSKSDKKQIKDLSFYTGGIGKKWKNRWVAFYYILIKKMSLVGAPISTSKASDQDYKVGLTGLVQINKNKIEDTETRDSFELYYLQNYSIWMDIDILAKSILNGYSLDEQLRDA